ncbi:MAG TPA: isochorismatase family protein [Wenzhouxiangellaceae bacterium]|nr:isochorismatase family protein [Wenzhouxiangellaceae bacterium]
MQLPAIDKIASFDVDSQRTFTPLCPDELPAEGGDEIGPELNRQAGLARWRLGSKDSHSPKAVWVTDDPDEVGKPGVEGENVEEHWPVHAVPGTEGFELVPGLPRPADYDYFVWKGVELDMHPYGACYHDVAEKMSTGVIEWLHSRDVSHVLVGGLATDYCVKSTALQLQAAGFQVLLNLAACRGIDDESVAEALAEMREAGIETFDGTGALESTG